MADENTDVKETQAVDESAAAATEQAVSQPDTGTNDVKLADGQSVADKTVPYTRFEEANTAAKEAKEAAEAAQQTIAQLQAQNQMLAQNKAPQEPTDLYAQTITRLGLQDEAYLTREQQGQVFNTMFDAISATQADASFMASHPDYSEVVGTQDGYGNFVPAAPLQRVLTQNPHLRQAVFSSPQGKMLAYELAKADPTYQESLKTKGLPPEVKAAADAKAIVDAAARQASISAAGTGQGSTDRAKAVQDMSEEEFQAYKDAIIAKAS
jgi:hypothetical protein